jgi:hypothetical protein
MRASYYSSTGTRRSHHYTTSRPGGATDYSTVTYNLISNVGSIINQTEIAPSQYHYHYHYYLVCYIIYMCVPLLVSNLISEIYKI